MTAGSRDLTFAALTPADAQEAARLFRTAIAEGGASGWDETAIAGALDAGGFGAVAFARPGRLAGAVLASPAGDVADIANIVVAAEARGGGVARALMTLALGMARDRGYERVMLEAAADNAPALGLYSAMGFNNVGRRPNYYRRGDVLISAEVFAIRLNIETTPEFPSKT